MDYFLSLSLSLSLSHSLTHSHSLTPPEAESLGEIVSAHGVRVRVLALVRSMISHFFRFILCSSHLPIRQKFFFFSVQNLHSSPMPRFESSRGYHDCFKLRRILLGWTERLVRGCEIFIHLSENGR